MLKQLEIQVGLPLSSARLSLKKRLANWLDKSSLYLVITTLLNELEHEQCYLHEKILYGSNR